MKKFKVLLDAGHGENTAGKRSPVWSDGTQLYEWSYNREIASRVMFALRQAGVDASLVVKENIDVPLSERVRRVNEECKEFGKSNVLLVSIHCNAGGGTGWEAFTSPGVTKSDEYADIFYKHAAKELPEFRMRTDNRNGYKCKEENFTIIKSTACPAILTENLFMDTEKDCKFLMTEYGKQAIMNLHVNAILEIWKSSKL